MLDVTLLSPQQTYLLGISGGRDSVALLSLLLEQGYRKLHLVHLNHQLRGRESDEDAQFVQQLADVHQLPLSLSSEDLTTISRQSKTSLETAARHTRHALFAKVAHETQCHQVLLAHHAEDQAETVLFNLLRGSAGLKGMTSRTHLYIGSQKLTLLRPLLQARRQEIDLYLTEKKIPYREDASNQDPTYTRNRIRNEGLPLLEEILQRDIVPTISRATQQALEQEEIITELLTHLQLLDPQERLFLPKLRELSPTLQKAALKKFLQQNKIPRISNQTICDALTIIPISGPSRINLPSKQYLCRKEGRIFIDS